MESRAIDGLIPYDKNPRDNESAIEHVLESLKQHGQVKPIVISAVNAPFTQETICAGHTTVEALKRYGAKTVNVVVKAFDNEKHFIDYCIRDNKTSEFASWDDKTLAELDAEFELSLDEMGFDLCDIGDISDDEPSESVETDSKLKISVKACDVDKVRELIVAELDKNELYYSIK